ncbi:MAG: FAD-dependent oxidoreductase [Chloroflexi bacterium]|jgi:thioredoxin reductase (NADPH)|nr:FAD-dependent oxidoreductase [Chloroflexota bacterium]
MVKPFILSVDDELQVLNAVNRDLRGHYRKDYRIVKASSGQEALDTLTQLKQRNDPVALLVADQRMPGMTGTEFLTEALKLYPDARKVLLTAYADTEAAITSINTIGLDHYLKKPWDPPEQNLFPVLDDLLDDWWANVPVPYDGIRVAGTLWSPSSHRVKDFISRNRIPYQWLDIEVDSEAKAIVDEVHKEQRGLPVVFMPEGQVLVNPNNTELAQAIGMQTEASEPMYDLIIIGAGPAGLGAAVYGGSEGLKTLMIDKAATGGQAGTSSRIENYLGFPKGLSGADLARRATAQAKRFGVEILIPQEAVSLRVDDPYKFVTLSDGTEVGCKALVIATGVTVRRLQVPGVESLEGAGIYYGAALTEAANYRGRHVFVVGGANSAGQGAMFFSRYASKVTMLVRGSSLAKGMSQYLVEQIGATANIEVLTRVQVVEAKGEDRLEALVLYSQDRDETWEMPAAAVFVFIGATAHTDMLEGVVERNNKGFIMTGQDLMEGGKIRGGWRLQRQPYMLETNIPGVFAVGDVRHASVKRVASAVGEGAIGVSQVHRYLRTV